VDKQVESCIPFCKAIVTNKEISLKRNVVALLESFWERCKTDERLPKWVKVLGLQSEAIHFDQRAIAAREATIDIGPPTQDEQCVFCGGSGYSVSDGTVVMCSSCAGLGWRFEPNEFDATR
jgi:hypothetical protein